MKQKLNNTPRGIRNNNPLNIRRYVHNDWLGKIHDDVAKDMEFEEFRHAKYGFRASFILIHRYIKQGFSSVRDIINRWSPTTDGNNVEVYLSVLRSYGLNSNDVIRCCDWKSMSALVEGMFAVENGVCIHDLPDRLYWYDAMSTGFDLYLERFVN